MPYWINHLMGNSDLEFSLSSLTQPYAELSKADQEHAESAERVAVSG